MALMIFMFSFATFKLDSVENSGINTTIEKRSVAAGVCVREIDIINDFL